MKKRLISTTCFLLISSVLYMFQLILNPYSNQAQASSNPETPVIASPYYGFTPFPYDTTPSAIRNTQMIIEKNSDLYAIHLDECLPWRQMLDNAPFPRYKQNDWDGIKYNIPNGHKVYVALAFLGTDRETLAPTCGQERDQFESLPSPLRSTSFKDQHVKSAYLNYVRKAIRQFNPDFLNLGIELEGLAHRFPSRWREFEDLFFYIRDTIKKENPNIKIGISLGLQPLLDPAVAARVKSVVEGSDYFGLSFYPYASSFHEKLGAPALNQGTASWIKPLEWARNFTNKPIAICETGYTTKDIHIRKYDLHMKGSTQEQADYVRDLLTISKRDNYMFVVWFLAIDYDKLYQKMPQNDETEINLLWRNIGLLDGNTQPKPAWNIWKQYKTLGKSEAKTTSSQRRQTAAPQAAPVITQESRHVVESSGIKIGFSQNNELPACASGTNVNISTSDTPSKNMSSMQWKYQSTGDWQWCVKQINTGRVTGTDKLKFWVRANTARQFFITLKEDNGEAFTKNFSVSTNWSLKTLDLKKLTADRGEVQDNKLDTSKITSMIISDPTSSDDELTLLISDMTFTKSNNNTVSLHNRSIQLEFNSDKDLFNCGSGSSPKIVASLPGTDGKSMQWEIHYNGKWQWCLKQLDRGKLAGTHKIGFKIRSNRDGPIFVNLTEDSGEAFYAIIDTNTVWKDVELKLDSLTLDNGKKRNNKIEPDDLIEIMFADPEGPNNNSGERKVWISDLRFM